MADSGTKLVIELTFDANAVAAPVKVAAQQANEIVTFAANAIAEAYLAQPPEPKQRGFFHAHIEGPTRNEEARKSAYANWILLRALQDLCRGVKRSLEEAMVYLEGIKLIGKEINIVEVNGIVAGVRKRANKRGFGEALKKVNEGLTEPLSFEKEFTSLQKIRNILEHRNGIVGVQDLAGAETLDLIVPRLGVFFSSGGDEKEISQAQAFEAQTEVYIKRVSRVKNFKVGDQITIDAVEFNEIAFACILFAEDLGKKLPAIQAGK